MKIRLLGTGTSHGVPVIGCTCKTCSSSNLKNKRYRTSAHISDGKTSVIIDMPAEYRIRALEYGINSVDAVLLTHGHADHTAGFDEIRTYNEMNGSVMPVFSGKDILDDIRNRYHYIFMNTQEGGGKPRVSLNELEYYRPFRIKTLEITPLPVMHGCMEIAAYRTGDFAYLTDVSGIPDKTFEYLSGLKILVLDALRHKEHPTHFSLSQAIEAAGRIGAEQTYFTHIAHALEHEETEKSLPKGMNMAYDGLEIIL